MARWERLYYAQLARDFNRRLYWPGLVGIGVEARRPAGTRLRPRSRLLERAQFVSVEEIKQFPSVDRRRSPGVTAEQREAGEVAVFQELGKALTSLLQLDQVLRTIMEKIDEFLR